VVPPALAVVPPGLAVVPPALAVVPPAPVVSFDVVPPGAVPVFPFEESHAGSDTPALTVNTNSAKIRPIQVGVARLGCMRFSLVSGSSSSSGF